MCTWPTSRLLRSVRRAACGVRLACRCRVLSLIRFSLSLSLSLSLSSLERGPVLPLIHHLPACLVCDCLPPSGPVGPAAHPDQVLRPVHHPAPRVARRQQQGGSGSGGPAVRCAVAGIRTTNSTTAPSLLAYLYAIPIQTTPAFFLNPTACPPPCPRLPVSRNASRTAPTGTSRLSTSSRGPRTPTYPSITTTTTSSSSTAAAALFPPRPLSRTNADPPLSSGLCCCAVVFRRDVIRYVASTRQNVGAGMM